MTEYFSGVDERAVLVDQERDPVTGRRIPARDSKDRGHGRSPSRAVRRAWAAPVAVALAVLVLAGGAAAAIAHSKSSSSKEEASATTIRSTATSSPSGAPGAGGSTVPGGAQTVVTYEGGSVVTQLNTSHTLGPLQFDCNAEGCRLLAAGIGDSPRRKGAGPWKAKASQDMGEICIINGVAAGREQFFQTWDLRGVGTTVVDGVKVPARIVGTFVDEVPGVPNCLPESRFEGRYDAVPTN